MPQPRPAPAKAVDADGAGEIVALFRIWHVAREQHDNPLPQMSAALGGSSSPELVPACDSFFALTQACLGRRLVASPDGSPAFSADEVALLETLRQVPALLTFGPNAALPHGLPGALQWAALAVLRALDVVPVLGNHGRSRTGQCPFLTLEHE